MPTAALASGNGSNLQAVIDASKSGELPLDIRLVVVDRPSALAYQRAERAGINASCLLFDTSRESRADYAERLALHLQKAGARLVLLLGWMHVLAPRFLEAGFDGVLNLHPAYLPLDPSADRVELPDGTYSPVFRGAHALRDAIRSGASTVGASLIQITADVDRGRVLARRTLALRPQEDESAALIRLHELERAVVREGVLAWLAQRQLK